MACKYFLPFSGLPFHSVDCVLWYMEVLNFDVVQCICFSFVAYTLLVSYPRKCQIQCHKKCSLICRGFTSDKVHLRETWHPAPESKVLSLSPGWIHERWQNLGPGYGALLQRRRLPGWVIICKCFNSKCIFWKVLHKMI